MDPEAYAQQMGIEDFAGEEPERTDALGFYTNKAMDLIVELLKGIRAYPVEEEIQIHALITQVLTQPAGLPVVHEKKLGPRSRIDFWVPCITTSASTSTDLHLKSECGQLGIGIEVKKGKVNRREIGSQAARYAAFDCIAGLILVVERGMFSPLTEVEGKPVRTVALSANWGISL